jgi:ABC-type bacteriocin/lantibiotic exporter with double-glycine peptidase domain
MITTYRKVYARFIIFLLPYRKKWLAVLALSVLGGLLSLAIPYLTKGAVDVSVEKRDLRALIIYAMIAGGIFVLGESLNWSRYALERSIKLKVNFDLHKKVFQHLLSLSYGWFQDKSTGEHIYTINNDIETVTEFITEALPQILSIVPRAVFTIVIIFYLNWKMALCALLLAPFLFLPNYFYSRILAKLWGKLAESSEKVLSCLQEIFSHIQLVKVWAAEKKSTISFLHKLIANVRITSAYLKPEIVNGIAVQVITKSIIGLIALLGGYLVIKGDMTLGSLAAIMVYLTQLVGLQSRLVSFWQSNLSGAVSCGRLTRILDTLPQISDAGDARSLDFKNVDIRFKAVSFGYRTGQDVIKELSFSINSGEHVALVGPSGSGKTTILNLLVRLYDPLEGTVIIDTRDIRSITLSCLKRQIGFSLQEHFLWDDTILNNITYCQAGQEIEEVEKIGRIAGVDDFVKALPLGYQTVVGENGCKLSEGQKQKIAIARALFKKPRILILDEAMSAMDSESEERIISDIKDHYKSLTMIIVSHRFSAIKTCDRVLYLSGQNRMIGSSLEDLLKDNAGFRSLFAGQI